MRFLVGKGNSDVKAYNHRAHTLKEHCSDSQGRWDVRGGTW